MSDVPALPPGWRRRADGKLVTPGGKVLRPDRLARDADVLLPVQSEHNIKAMQAEADR